MRAGGENGAHVEYLILGSTPNPTNIIDDPENKTEIKSCQEYHKARLSKYGERRRGSFKINIDQHNYLLEIDGYYLFVVINGLKGPIIRKTKIPAREIELYFNFKKRKITKHHYFSANWRSVFLLAPL